MNRFVPIAGDAVAAVWKANSRNALLLEEFLTLRGQELLSSSAPPPSSSVPPIPARTHAAAAQQGAPSASQVRGDIKPGSGLKPGERVDIGGAGAGGTEKKRGGWGWGRGKNQTQPVVETV